MNFVRSTVLAALTCLVTMSGLAQTPVTPSKLSQDEILKQRVAECSTYEESDDPDECVRLGNVTAQALLIDSLAWLKIPAGIALPPDDAGNTRFTFHPADLSVRSILDSIVYTDSRYKWSIENGVINLLPKADPLPLLEVRLAEFKQEEVPVRIMLEALEDMPEVRSRATALGFTDTGRGFIQIGFIDTRKFTVKCQNCTVREALNAIARQSGRTWMYREYNYEGTKNYRFQ